MDFPKVWILAHDAVHPQGAGLRTLGILFVGSWWDSQGGISFVNCTEVDFDCTRICTKNMNAQDPKCFLAPTALLNKGWEWTPEDLERFGEIEAMGADVDVVTYPPWLSLATCYMDQSWWNCCACLRISDCESQIVGVFSHVLGQEVNKWTWWWPTHWIQVLLLVRVHQEAFTVSDSNFPSFQKSCASTSQVLVERNQPGWRKSDLLVGYTYAYSISHKSWGWWIVRSFQGPQAPGAVEGSKGEVSRKIMLGYKKLMELKWMKHR